MVDRVDLTPTKVSLPPGITTQIIWYPDDEWKVFYLGDRFSSSIQYVAMGQNEITHLFLPSEQLCKTSDYIVPNPLPDRRLGLVQICYDRLPTNQQGRRDVRYLVAYDWQNQSLERIVSQSLSERLQAAYFSWNPDMTLGVQSVAGGRDTIWWLNREAPFPMEITITEGNRSWSLAENLRIMDSMDQDIYFNAYDVGNARSAVWSPDGKTIAFFASAQAIGKGGLNRMFSEYRLYLMDPSLQQPYPVLSNLHEPSTLLWSPDSRWLAFIAEWGKVGAENAYVGLFSPSQKQLYLLSRPPNSQFLSDLAWSPFGNELALVVRLAPVSNFGLGDSEVYIYDIADLTVQTSD